jgi:hypothetical protein
MNNKFLRGQTQGLLMIQRESRCSPCPLPPINGFMEFVAVHNMPPKREFPPAASQVILN